MATQPFGDRGGGAKQLHPFVKRCTMQLNTFKQNTGPRSPSKVRACEIGVRPPPSARRAAPSTACLRLSWQLHEAPLSPGPSSLKLACGLRPPHAALHPTPLACGSLGSSILFPQMAPTFVDHGGAPRAAVRPPPSAQHAAPSTAITQDMQPIVQLRCYGHTLQHLRRRREAAPSCLEEVHKASQPVGN